MWVGRRGGDRTVSCIACGASLPREDAREYDKQGDRWDRRDKEFEYMCKPCHDELCHQPRPELESLLVAVGEDAGDQGEFLADYATRVEADSESRPGTERES